MTDRQGHYSFNQLSGPAANPENASGVSATGNYNVRLVLPPGLTQTSANPATISISRGDTNVTGVNFSVASQRGTSTPGWPATSSGGLSGVDLAVDVADAGAGPAQRGVESGVEQPVLVHLVEADRDVERRRFRVPVLAGDVLVQLVGGDGEVPDPPLEEVSGERGLGQHQQLGRLRRLRNLAEERAEPAEVFLVGAFVGAHLSDGEAEHG